MTFFEICTDSDHNHDLDKQMFELKLDKLSFFAGRSWSRCASGGCQEEQGGQKRRLIFIFVFFGRYFYLYFVLFFGRSLYLYLPFSI